MAGGATAGSQTEGRKVTTLLSQFLCSAIALLYYRCWFRDERDDLIPVCRQAAEELWREEWQ